MAPLRRPVATQWALIIGRDFDVVLVHGSKDVKDIQLIGNQVRGDGYLRCTTN